MCVPIAWSLLSELCWSMTLRTTFDRLMVIACCASLIGCTTLNPVDLSRLSVGASTEASPSGNAESDSVLIEMKDGRKFEARLERVSESSVEIILCEGGAMETLQRNEIASIGRREFSPTKTVILVAGVVLGVYAYVYVKLIRALGGAS
jgi:hypothetical protein